MPQTYPTDERGIMTEGAIDTIWDGLVKAGKATYGNGLRAVAEAQHQADVEKVRAVENNFVSTGWTPDECGSFEACRRAVIEALGVKPC